MQMYMFLYNDVLLDQLMGNWVSQTAKVQFMQAINNKDEQIYLSLTHSSKTINDVGHTLKLTPTIDACMGASAV